MLDRLLVKIYDLLHRKYHERTMEWYTLRTNVNGKIIVLRVYGPKGMRVSDVVFEEIPGKMNWYRLEREG